MNERFAVFVCVMLVCGVGSASAQDHHQGPYAAEHHREIKALSADEVQSLLEGEGMGFALAAELNGVPGPKHALELADSLGLTVDQRTTITAIFDDMARQAQALGAQIVALERELDAGFAAKTISVERLRELVEAIAIERGRLRVVHLQAHLAVFPVLTAPQRAAYDRLRGYAMEH
jgi:Spy/CpxP family protein refolding chaperone